MKTRCNSNRPLILLGLILVLGAVFFVGMGHVSNIYQERGLEYGTDIRAALEVQSYIKRAEGHLGLYLMLGDQVDLDKYEERVEDAEKNIEILKKIIVAPNRKKHIQLIEDELQKFKSVADNLLVKGPKGKLDQESLKALGRSAEVIRSEAVSLATYEVVIASLEASSAVKQMETELLLSYFQTASPADKKSYLDRLQKVDDLTSHLKGLLYANQLTKYEYVVQMDQGLTQAKETGEDLIESFELEPNSFNPMDHENVIREFHAGTSSVRRAGVALATDEIFDNNKFLGEASEEVMKWRVITVAVFLLAIILISLSEFTRKRRR